MTNNSKYLLLKKMKNHVVKRVSFKRKLIMSFLLFLPLGVFAWTGMPMPKLHIEGRYLKDPHGNTVNLHGFAQTYSPWFNEEGRKWSNYNVAECLKYNKGIIDGIVSAGWKMSFIRLHMDPYWSNNPNINVAGEHDISQFNFTRFKTYLNSVFIPMAEYAISKGMYVVMRPPGVCPGKIAVGDAYNKYLIKVWGWVAQQPKLKNNPYVMFELANEPVDILGTDGTYGAGSQGHFDNLKTYFQAVVDTVRASADNILWIPGLGYQSLYQGYAVNPIVGKNIGYAVHVYPGWFNSGQGYANFQKGWNNQVKPVADFAPVMVTEMDWAPAKYNMSWGKDSTGVAGGIGFGANFKKITDDCGNVSWLIFTGPNLLAKFTGIPPAPGAAYTFYNDPQACPWPTFTWYKEYTKINFPRPEFVNKSTKDNGDGTFANPVINGDFPDPILVKKNETYYMVSKSSNKSADSIILSSRDLVNWEYCSESIDSIPLINKKPVDDSNVNSGTMIQTKTGEWWAMVSYKKGSYGMFPQLLPVKMVDNKPVVNELAKDSIKIKKPNVGRDYSTTSLVTNDVFRNYKLGLQWEWNGNSDKSKWSLMDRAGFMRLKTVNVVDSLNKSKNILSQRILVYPKDLEHSYGTTRLEIKGMREGDVTGLSVYNDIYGYIGVKMINGEKRLVTYINNEVQAGEAVNDSVIYLRAVANFNTRKAGFYYSLDDSIFTKMGNDMNMEPNSIVSTGNRFGIFNYATVETGGFVDVDWFSTESDFNENKFFDSSFAGYSEKSLTLSEIKVDGGNNLTILTKSSSKLTVKAYYADGHTEDISNIAEYTNHNPDIITISNGTIISKGNGDATLTIGYTGPLGEKKQITLNVTSTSFPLTSKLFNPSIYSTGTFNETTKTLKTGQWGFGGWAYSNGIDLSAYKYLVFKLSSISTCGASLRLFDENNYWGGCATYDFNSAKQINVNLATMVKNGTTTKVDPSHLYIIGLWSTGASNIVISDVYVTNNTDYSKPTALDEVSTDIIDENELVDVYNLMGIKVLAQIKRSEAVRVLPNGLFIIGHQKVMIRK